MDVGRGETARHEGTQQKGIERDAKDASQKSAHLALSSTKRGEEGTWAEEKRRGDS